jgi:hypothetical protein
MDRVEQIEAAISGLGAEEFRRLYRWLQDLDQKRWDEQMDSDNASGKLDLLFNEADDELAGRWPPPR